jgi:hypothetical protein
MGTASTLHRMMFRLHAITMCLCVDAAEVVAGCTDIRAR